MDRDDTLNVDLTHRPLTPDEARLIHEELKTTANIFGYTVPELLRFQDVFVAVGADGRLAGVCISKDLLFGWTDIAALYVLPTFRGKGVGGMLYEAAFRRAEERGRHIFTLSRSPQVIGLMKRYGMHTTPAIWQAPLAVHLHMNRHMMSLYRVKEMLRKSKLPRDPDAPPLTTGLKKRSVR
jgi:GNAT superfamily N-acetyltransferase